MVATGRYRCSVEALNFAEDSTRIQPRIKVSTGEPLMGVSAAGTQSPFTRAEDGDGSEITAGTVFMSGDQQTSCLLLSIKKVAIGG